MELFPKLTTYLDTVSTYRRKFKCILSDHHRLKLDVNNRKLTNSWKLNNSLLNEKLIKTEIN